MIRFVRDLAISFVIGVLVVSLLMGLCWYATERWTGQQAEAAISATPELVAPINPELIVVIEDPVQEYKDLLTQGKNKRLAVISRVIQACQNKEAQYRSYRDDLTFQLNKIQQQLEITETLLQETVDRRKQYTARKAEVEETFEFIDE